MITSKNIKSHLYCECCKFQATRPSEWLIHIESNKHKRDGKPKTKICNICNKEFANHFIMKIHMLSTHASREEKLKHKYYCKVCDIIFLSELYYIQHNKGKKHNNMVKILNMLNKNIDINSFIKETNEFINNSNKFIRNLNFIHH